MGKAARLKQKRRSTFQQQYDEEIAGPCYSADGVRVKVHIYRVVTSGRFACVMAARDAESSITIWDVFCRALQGAKEIRAVVPLFSFSELFPSERPHPEHSQFLDLLSLCDGCARPHFINVRNGDTSRAENFWHVWIEEGGEVFSPCTAREIAAVLGSIPRRELIALER